MIKNMGTKELVAGKYFISICWKTSYILEYAVQEQNGLPVLDDSESLVFESEPETVFFDWVVVDTEDNSRRAYVNSSELEKKVGKTGMSLDEECLELISILKSGDDDWLKFN